MSLDIDKIIAEDIDVKNEFTTIFKKLEGGFKGLIGVYEKSDKAYAQISDNLKEYAKATSASGKEEASPFFALGNNYEAIIDSHKQLSLDITDDIIIVLQHLVGKSALLDETYKDLNSYIKDVRKLRNKVAKIEAQIEDLHAKGRPEKVTKKESEKQKTQEELNSANDRLKSSKERYDNAIGDFNQERDEILKGALKKLVSAENTYIGALKGIIGGLEKATGGKVTKTKAPVVEEAPAEEETTEEAPADE
ncbi:MAG: hypothetical protein HWN67_07175 [Candidatus Helarchaeota archaeon]|nr:hypothetical protein [Candidatus Helarchaeota archaeon]